MSERVRLTQEKETLLMTLYLRALDNRRATPILGDRHAQAILDRIDYDFAGLGSLRGNAPLIATRARRFDTWTREFFAGHPDGLVLHLACGLDSRPLRITRPARSQWIDVDYPDVIALRERLYGPIEGVRTLGSSVTEPGWWDQVPPAGPPSSWPRACSCTSRPTRWTGSSTARCGTSRAAGWSSTGSPPG